MTSNVLLIDVETSPITGYTWGVYETDVLQVLEPAKIICASWKWLEKDEVYVKCLADYTDYKPNHVDDSALVHELWNVLDKADVVIGHNADSFDIKRLNTRFIFYGLTSPSPYKTIDTLKVAKKYFKFDNNTLDQLGQYLGEGRKELTGGFSLWLKCMAGDKTYWDKMKKYNQQDVVLLEKIYLRLRPYMLNHPDVNETSETPGTEFTCPVCSSTDVEKRGFSYTRVGKKQRYQCRDCGSWATGNWTRNNVSGS